eukprot:1292250-Alexandrium_andersonii.AAC.1
MFHGARVAGDQDCPETAQVQLVDRALRSALFWAYLLMLDMVGTCLLTLSMWVEACPCHERELGLVGPSRHLRRQAFARLTGTNSCPLRGMRTPELAMGEAPRQLSSLLRRAQADLLMHANVRA